MGEFRMSGCRFVEGDFGGGTWFDDHGAGGIREYAVTVGEKSQKVVERLDQWRVDRSECCVRRGLTGLLQRG